MKKETIELLKKLKESLKMELKEQKERSLLEQLPVKIKQNRLHNVLGVDPNLDLNTLTVPDLTSKCKRGITNGEVDLKTMVAMLNWQAVMNKTKNPEFSTKLRSVIANLHNEMIPQEATVKYMAFDDVLKEHPEIKEDFEYLYASSVEQLTEKSINFLQENNVNTVIVYLNENGMLDVIPQDKFDHTNMVYVEKVSIDDLE